MSRFDWIIGAGAMMIAGYESMSLIGGVAELLSARRGPGIERSRLDNQAPPTEPDTRAQEPMGPFRLTRISEAEYSVSINSSSYYWSVDTADSMARIEPSFRNGKCDGFRLVRFTSNSIYAALGFRSGDVIHYLNGFPMDSPDSAPAVYQHLRDAAYVDVEFERRGVALRTRYWVR